MNKVSPRIILLALAFTCTVIIILNYENILIVNKQISQCFGKNDLISVPEQYAIISRDFFRYKCKNMKRIGGNAAFMKYSQHDLFRIEGAWFICADEGVTPVKDNCVVLSFGINDDESFDRVMNKNYGCQVESFDPFIEHKIFQDIRAKSPSLKDSVSLNIEPKWRFHKMGIVGNESIQNVKKLQWMTTYHEIIKYTGLENKVVDIVKIDTEGSEWSSIQSMNIDYICKYVKQFMLETHPIGWKFNPGMSASHLAYLKKLEKCFLLFHRDTRFYKQFEKAEFQPPRTHKVDLNEFNSETDLIDFMVTFGELYFVNRNFLPN